MVDATVSKAVAEMHEGSSPSPGTIFSVSWCSGLTCQPVKLEIAGPNPVETAIYSRKAFAVLCEIASSIAISRMKRRR